MPGKSGKRHVSNKKKQGGESGEASTGSGAIGGNRQFHLQPSGAGPPVPKPPSNPQRRIPQPTQSVHSEGSRGHSPMMMVSPPATGFTTMASQYGQGLEPMMHIPSHFMPAGGAQHPHHQHQHQQHHQGSLPTLLTAQPLGGPGAFRPPNPYYPQQIMNYPTMPSPPQPPLGSLSHITTTARGYVVGTAANTLGTGGGAGETPNAMGTTTTAATDGMNLMVQQYIERGLQIDFYSEGDHILLASWASFFRDQFIETRNELAKAKNDRTAEAYRRATGFVERVEMKVLETNAMKQIFRRWPITPVDDPVCDLLG
jgi:hypothetical protein